MELWNIKDLQPPPVNTCIAPMKEVDVKILSSALEEAIEFFEDQGHLHAEAALLSRIIYRTKNKFRSAKEFKSIEKLNRCLLNYLAIDITGVLKSLNIMVPRRFVKNVTYLPTKNMLDFVLIRLQGLGKLFCRIIETCKIAALQLQCKLRIGHFWKILIVFYSMVARFFAISKSIIKFVCNLYQKLEPFSAKLRNPSDWSLLNDHVLPQNLGEWLEIDLADLETTTIEIPDDENDMILLNLIHDSDSDVEISDEYILIGDDARPKRGHKKKDFVGNFRDIISLEDSFDYETHIGGKKTNKAKKLKKNHSENDETRPVLQGFEDSDFGEVITLDDTIAQTSEVKNEETDEEMGIKSEHLIASASDSEKFRFSADFIPLNNIPTMVKVEVQKKRKSERADTDKVKYKKRKTITSAEIKREIKTESCNSNKKSKNMVKVESDSLKLLSRNGSSGDFIELCPSREKFAVENRSKEQLKKGISAHLSKIKKKNAKKKKMKNQAGHTNNDSRNSISISNLKQSPRRKTKKQNRRTI